MGVPITMETIGDGTEVGYRVRPDDYCLPDLGLTRRRDRGAARRGERDLARRPAPGTGALDEARRRRRPRRRRRSRRCRSRRRSRRCSRRSGTARSCTFAYRGETRTLEPWGLSSKRGHWYVVGFDRVRDAVRAFRADRIDGDVEVGPSRTRSRSPPTSAPTTTSKTGRGCSATRRPSRCGSRSTPTTSTACSARSAPKRASNPSATPRRRHGRRGHGHQPRRVPQLRARLPRARRDPRTARDARRRSSSGSKPSRRAAWRAA